MDKLLIVCGPTATGKTRAALQLAKILNGELVSADSRQVYKGMDIVTGKDLHNSSIVHGSRFMATYHKTPYSLFAYNMQGIPIWMYDVVDPDKPFSVAVYQKLALTVIDSIYKRKHVPIIVGGTGLYIKSLTEPFDTFDVPPDAALRKKLSSMSVVELQNRLQKDSVDSWNMLNNSDRNNPRRLIRKIEIAIAGTHPHRRNITPKYDTYIVGLTAPKEDIFKRIDKRVDVRMEQGALEEVTKLHEKYDWPLPAMSVLGYKEWKLYFDRKEKGLISTEEENIVMQGCIAAWKTGEHNYAKRQMTWFKKNPEVHWYDCTDSDMQKNMTADIMRWYTG